MRLGDDGWLWPSPGDVGQGAGIIRHVISPHWDARPSGMTPELMVVHNISLPAGQFGGPYIEQLFCGTLDCSSDPGFVELQGVRVSAHFLIRRDGELIQFVGVHERAWHAGVSSLMGRNRCNDFSIGVELEGCDDQRFEPAQMGRLAELCGCLEKNLPTLSWIAGHSDIAPGRKTDPGPMFDWPALINTLLNQGSRLKNPFVRTN